MLLRFSVYVQELFRARYLHVTSVQRVVCIVRHFTVAVTVIVIATKKKKKKFEKKIDIFEMKNVLTEP